jgi:hypothetical protein
MRGQVAGLARPNGNPFRPEQPLRADERRAALGVFTLN